MCREASGGVRAVIEDIRTVPTRNIFFPGTGLQLLELVIHSFLSDRERRSEVTLRCSVEPAAATSSFHCSDCDTLRARRFCLTLFLARVALQQTTL